MFVVAPPPLGVQNIEARIHGCPAGLRAVTASGESIIQPKGSVVLNGSLRSTWCYRNSFPLSTRETNYAIVAPPQQNCLYESRFKASHL